MTTATATGPTIPCEEVRKYLDTVIEHWREEREKARKGQGEFRESDCACYIDAFQSARVSLLGETLPIPGWDSPTT